MGAWGADSFENDTACDWAYGLAETRDLSRVAQAIQAVVAEGEYLESDLACEAIAACEVLARLQGRFGQQDAYTESLDAWVAANPQAPPPELIQAGAEAIDRIEGENSELAELWNEDGPNEDWRQAMQSLRSRLVG